MESNQSSGVNSPGAHETERLDRPAAQTRRSDRSGTRLQFQPVVREVGTAIAELFTQPRTDADLLLSIVERIRAETAIEPFDTVLQVLNRLPEPTTTQFQLKRGIESKSFGIVLEQGVRSAYMISSLLTATSIPRSAHDTVMLAALLQDFGFVTLEKWYRSTPRNLEAGEIAAFRSHPLHGAALAGGLRRCASDLPTLIAEHHECLNGVGYPNGIRARQLTNSSRLLQIVCRLVDQVSAGVSIPDSDSGVVLPLTAAIARAGDDLEEMSALGRLDRGLTENVLQRIRSTRIDVESAARSGTEKTAATERLVPPPKFLAHGTAAEFGVFVQSTADQVSASDVPSA